LFIQIGPLTNFETKVRYNTDNHGIRKKTLLHVNLEVIACLCTKIIFLPVRLLVWEDRRGTVAQADGAARAELQGAPKQKLLQLNKYSKIPLGQAQGDAYLLFRCLP
jgi:hypothetical protein